MAIGGAVGAVAGLGGAYLAGGLASVGNKLISDTVSSISYGTINFGSWEDYAVAFAVGGFIKGKGYRGITKWLIVKASNFKTHAITRSKLISSH
jgi:hypothetical protein